MEENPSPGPNPELPYQASQKTDGGKTGCIIVASGCLVLLLIMGGVGIYVALNFQKLAAEATRAVIVEMIKGTDLPDDQKEEITQIVDTVVEDFIEGRIDVDQLERIFEEARPLIEAIGGVVAVQRYVKPSGLTEEEKLEAEVTVRRFMHGVFESKIPQAALDEVQKYFVEETATNSFEPKQLTDDELREALQLAKEEADKAAIPTDIPAPNLAGELRKAVDRGYAK